jgi:uncharacterized protein
MKYLFQILLLAFIMTNCGLRYTDFSNLKYRAGLYYNGEGKIFSGKTKSLTKSGIEIFEGRIKYGLKHGKWIYYNESGIKRSSGYFKAGMKDGKWLYFDANGKITREEYFTNGKIITNPDSLD